MSYSLIDHTADIAIRVTGSDKKSLFLHCGYALFDLLYETTDLHPTKTITIKANGTPSEDLLINFMRELFFNFAIYKLVLSKIVIDELTEDSITATVSCEELDLERHVLNNDIKAVTYHDVHIENEGDSLTVTIVFDT